MLTFLENYNLGMGGNPENYSQILCTPIPQLN